MAKRGPAGQDGDEPRDADPAAAGDDRVTAAADELYSADPGEFIDRRKALADAARVAGDAPAANRIAGLRKPTRAAWVVNRLARADPDAPGRLAELAAALREAEQAKDGRRLRELSAARGPLVDSLTAQALAAAGVADPPSGLREEVTETLTSAIGDPKVAADFAAGTLTRAAQWAGFGLASFGETPLGTAPDEAGADEARKPAAERRLRVVPAPADGTAASAASAASAPASAGSRRGVAGRVSEEEQARRARAEEQRLAEEAAERAAERRQAFEDAELTVTLTAAAAAEAGAAEDRLEAEVRDLEQRLTQAREDLAAARMRARRAESAERRARQTLDRLPRPE